MHTPTFLASALLACSTLTTASGQSYALDPTFGTAGKAIAVFPTAATTDVATSMALLPGGKILVAGQNNNMFGLAQLTAIGQPDLTFGTAGTATADFTGLALMSLIYTVGPATAMTPLVQPDGNILVAGKVATVGTYSGAAGPDRKACARFRANGTPDNTFGTNGRFINEQNTGSLSTHVNALALQADGSIYSVNYRIYLGGNQSTTIERFSSTGLCDFAYAPTYPRTGNGAGAGSGTQVAYAAAVDNAGGLLTAGVHLINHQNYVGPQGSALIRYQSNGQPDPSFGTNGIAIINAAPTQEILCWQKMLLQADNKIIVAGTQSNDSIAVARYNSNGTLDQTFGKQGVLKAATGSTFAAILGLSVLSTGEILTGVRTAASTCRIFRFSATTPTFTASSITVPGFSLAAMAVQPNERVLVAGTQNDGSGNKRFGVVGLVYSSALSSRGAQANNLELFPNPAAQALTLRFAGLPLTQPYTLRVLDVLGREVLTRSNVWPLAGEVHLSLQNIRPGSYTLQVQGAAYSTSRRFVRAE